MFKRLLVCFCLLCWARVGEAADQLLYFEGQGIAGYSSELRKPIYYSMNPDAEMQKPSLGFDYLKRFSGESGDIAIFALQGRLALRVDGEDGHNSVKSEPQVYNAYLKFKTPGPYVWVGHNRPAFGLSSYFDSHGLLLRTLAIQGFGYDRDWGGGLYRDFSWGDVSATVTTGSGMPILFRGGNYMTAGRVSYGVLSQENMNVGLSLGYGKTMNTMGYKQLDPEPRKMALVGIDATLLRNNLEHRFDSLAGKWLGENTYAAAYRFGVNLDPENRFKIEVQPAWWRIAGDNNYQLSSCFSVVATSNITVRLASFYDHDANDNR